MTSFGTTGTIDDDTHGTASLSQVQRHDDFRIALYYTYIVIDNVEEHVLFHNELCRELDLGGRIRVSSEGLNGVLSGRYTNLQHYQHRVETRLSLNDTNNNNNNNNNKISMDVKYCLLRHDLSVTLQLFDSLSVKATREVVSLYEPTAQDMQPQHQKLLSSKKEKKFYRRRRRNRQKHEQLLIQQQQPTDLTMQNDASSWSKYVPNSPFDTRLESFHPAPHLTPTEWNQRLMADRNKNNAIILDARNFYESRIGYFKIEGIPTLLTNTRKYSSLPHVLQQPHMKQALAGKTIYMYCTGGVRCERASVLLQAMDWTNHDDPNNKNGLEPPTQIYQLDGGIQRYLEQYGYIQNQDADNHDNNKINDNNNNYHHQKEECFFRGKNFVFDPRRTDPIVGRDVVGTCLRCHVPHDDYDNGMPPCQNTEARCCKCRILILLCTHCRTQVRVWGEPEHHTSTLNGTMQPPLPPLYCGLETCMDEGNLVKQANWLNE